MVERGPQRQPLLFEELRRQPVGSSPLLRELAAFSAFGARTRYATAVAGSGAGRRVVDLFVNEFWTSAQRQAHGLHEVSYRACFKPQLPAFFIERLTAAGDVVYDPFMGRGTTLLEAALKGRVPCGNDVNPLSVVLTRPRLRPPTIDAVEARLREIDLGWGGPLPDDLLVFFHEQTLRELCALRAHLLREAPAGGPDPVDDWIRMVAVNRLTGHSPGFFSVYTLPPNQAVSVAAQRKINQDRQQQPPRRDVRALIARKSRALLAEVTEAQRDQLHALAARATLSTAPADATPAIAAGSVRLVVTSPPFLDVVQYRDDNWLRCWFCAIDPAQVPITQLRSVEAWQQAMTGVFGELRRLLQPDGHVAFEVGEVRRGTVRLEEVVIPAAVAAGLEPELVLVNQQEFTKTANCWGVDNNRKGTNTNRVVVLGRGRA